MMHDPYADMELAEKHLTAKKHAAEIEAVKASLEKREGVKFDQGKLPYSLLPPELLERVARVLQFGAGKYGPRNWEKGMDWSRVFDATMRHLWAWFSGEDDDPETGFCHLDHAACNIAFLIAYDERGVGLDDRPTTVVG